MSKIKKSEIFKFKLCYSVENIVNKIINSINDIKDVNYIIEYIDDNSNIIVVGKNKQRIIGYNIEKK